MRTNVNLSTRFITALPRLKFGDRITAHVSGGVHETVQQHLTAFVQLPNW